ncbi:MAG TPA: hypothetical protein PLE28_02640 [bacterium]|nr:hypothetical protein [bacterium]
MFKNSLKKTILFTAVFSLIFLSACGIKKEKELTMAEAQAKAEQFINKNFMTSGASVTITNMVEDEQTGLYKFSLDLGDGQVYDSYISKDGKEFFPQAYNIAELEKTLNTTTSETSASTTEEGTINEASFNESVDYATDKKVAVYLFWGDGCPHCASQKTAMSDWTTTYPDIEIKTYETWKNTDNAKKLEDMAKAYNTTVEGVPMTFIGDKYWVGYSDDMKTEMINKIEECLKDGCENPGDRLK